MGELIMTSQNYLIHVIGDYCDHNAFNRVKQKLRLMLKNAGVPFEKTSFDETWVPQFDTRATGFNLAELARNSELADDDTRHIFFVNTAPRKDDTKGRSNNAGEKLIYARLDNGVEILGVNSGYSFSFLDDAIVEARHLDISDKGSQFRSLNVFPHALERLAKDDETLMLGDAKADIPSRPSEYSINLIDGYGNVKTNIKANDFDESNYGCQATLTVHGVEHPVKISHRLFEDPEGTGLVLYCGSSGWVENGETVQFMEVALRGASAADFLDDYEAENYTENGIEFDLEIHEKELSKAG